MNRTEYINSVDLSLLQLYLLPNCWILITQLWRQTRITDFAQYLLLNYQTYYPEICLISPPSLLTGCWSAVLTSLDGRVRELLISSGVGTAQGGELVYNHHHQAIAQTRSSLLNWSSLSYINAIFFFLIFAICSLKAFKSSPHLSTTLILPLHPKCAVNEAESEVLVTSVFMPHHLEH